jgi:AcrR family transcriptional regulator
MAKSTKNSRGARTLTPKGIATRAAILNTAHEVFKTKGYFSSSIAEITRRCGVSMATFYQYYKNKEQVFQELNDLIISRFLDQAGTLSLEGLDFEQRLKSVLHLLFCHTRDNLPFNRILGESQLIDRVTIAYYDSIARYYRNFMRLEARSGNIRPLDPNIIAYGLIGICYFHSLDWETTDEGLSRNQIIDLIMDLIMNGISGQVFWERSPGWSLTSMPDPLPLHHQSEEPLTKGEKTRQAIFRAAENVFGRYGVNGANISEITREAGVAQGTFYVHFESKNDLIEGFVKYFNHKMRRELQRVVAKTVDRRDAERVGILSFFEFTRQHRRIYRLVPECEIISREVSLWYYKKLAHGYIKGLRRGIEKGEIRKFPPVFLARSLMGFTHFIALKWIIWQTNSGADLPKQLLADIIELLLFGIKPFKK